MPDSTISAIREAHIKNAQSIQIGADTGAQSVIFTSQGRNHGVLRLTAQLLPELTREEMLSVGEVIREKLVSIYCHRKWD